MSSYVFKSIIGNIELVSSKNRIIAVHRTRKKPNKTEDKLLKRSALQIKLYLAKKRQSLNFPTTQIGTKFQNRVWNYLRSVPYGKTTTYGEIARKLSKIDPKLALDMSSFPGANFLESFLLNEGPRPRPHGPSPWGRAENRLPGTLKKLYEEFGLSWLQTA